MLFTETETGSQRLRII